MTGRSHGVAAPGYKEVEEEEKSRLVGNVSTSMATNYDLMNEVMSDGMHRLWEEKLVSKLNPFPGTKHLDVAGGTGDVACRILESINNVGHRALRDHDDNVPEETQIFVCDILGEKASSRERVWKRGGKFLCLELSHVELPIFKELQVFRSWSLQKDSLFAHHS